MSEPITVDQFAAMLHRELAPIRSEIGHVRDSIEGKEGLQIDVAVMATRVGALEEAVRANTPRDPPQRPRVNDSDQGWLTVKLSGSGWQRIVRWLLAVLLPAGVVSGGTYWAVSDDPSSPTEAPRAVTVPAPPVPHGPQELP